jgi:hypothetical protein
MPCTIQGSAYKQMQPLDLGLELQVETNLFPS